jgi:hypothetical protein
MAHRCWVVIWIQRMQTFGKEVRRAAGTRPKAMPNAAEGLAQAALEVGAQSSSERLLYMQRVSDDSTGRE